MTVSFPEHNPPVQQNNFGPGPFVAGHNFGNIEMVDDRTRAALAKISNDLPPVGALLSKALDEGLIPPETVRTLAGVAQNLNADTAHWIHEGGRGINEDTASWIWQGGQGINEDTASWIAQAARNINPEVASSLTHTAGELKEAADRFEDVLRQISSTSGALRASKTHASQWSQTAAAMQRAAGELAMARQVEANLRDKYSAKWFGYGAIAGFVAAIVLAVLVIVIMVNAT
ncbi:hypothetical protein ACIBEF_23265 [Micromonospora sp. NPDC050795]|uniref:hypothetical protein n=1 Tax=Micromonospora sp. NPDC050795 TaxID=3364282 RepID=UPI0037B448FC